MKVLALLTILLDSIHLQLKSLHISLKKNNNLNTMLKEIEELFRLKFLRVEQSLDENRLQVPRKLART